MILFRELQEKNTRLHCPISLKLDALRHSMWVVYFLVTPLLGIIIACTPLFLIFCKHTF